MKKFLITLLLIAIPSFVFAVPTSVDRVTNFIQPLIRSDFIKATYFTATSTSQASTFPYASSTALTVSGGLYNTSLSDGCLNVATGLIGSTGAACGAGSSPVSSTTSTVAGQAIVYPNNATDIWAVGSNATTTAEFYFDPNLNIATIGANPSFLGGKVYTNGIFSTPTQLMLTDSVNDLQSNMVIGNTYSAGDGYYATGGITFVNGRSTQGASFQTSDYYTYMGLSGPNFVAFTGLPPNGFVINNTDGPIVYGATSANIASSTQCWAIGSGFAVGNYDMCLKNVDTLGSTNTASGGLGLGTTSPWARLSIAASSTATFPYLVVAQHINGAYTNASPVFIVHQNENVGVGVGTPSARLGIQGGGTTTGRAFAIANSSSVEKLVVLDNGQVRIGSGAVQVQATPLEVMGTASSASIGTEDEIKLIRPLNGLEYPKVASFKLGKWSSANLTSSSRLDIALKGGANGTYDADNTVMSLLSGLSGTATDVKVGVGSTSPWAQLSVNPNGISGPAFAIGSSTRTTFIVTNVGRTGIGTSSPSTQLHVSSGANATTTITVGELGLNTSKACVNMNRSDGGAGSFYLNSAGVIVSEANYCR
jgi:hypothetical protein